MATMSGDQSDESSILCGRTLRIDDLNEVIALLEKHHYKKASYHKLGVRLNLSYNTLDEIETRPGDVDHCLTECLASWLRRADRKVKTPTIHTLVAALRNIGENAVADGIDEERINLNGSFERSEDSQQFLAQSTNRKRQSPSDAKPATVITESEDHQKSQQSLSSSAKPAGKNSLSSKLLNKIRKKNKKDQPSLPLDTSIATSTVQLEGNFGRRKSGFSKGADIKKKDYAFIERGDSMFIHFKEEKKGLLKSSYDMTACIGVYHRNSLDHVKNKWPDDAESQCCFKVVDKDDAKTLYLVADNQDIAEEWVKELQRRVNMHKKDKRKGEFGPNDLDKLYDILIEELETLPWDELGASLGLWDSTIDRIRKCCTTDEDRLRQCLLHWLQWDGLVYETGGPTCDNLKEVLKFLKKEEIAKKIDEEILHTKGTETNVQDVKNETARQKAWARSGKIDQHDQAVATAKKVSCGKMLLDAVTYKMQQNDVGSVLAEISFLSNKERSSLVTIDNKTSIKIDYHKCFIARGREARYVGFDRDVPPKSRTSYSFEKFTPHSLEGCAAMICFSATTNEPQPTKCFFVVAFRNHFIKSNKTALLILNSLKSIEELSDSKDYGDIIRNTNDNPVKLKYACNDDKYRTTFMWVGCGNMAELKFPFIEFHLYMNNDYYHSHSTITVSHPETDA